MPPEPTPEATRRAAVAAALHYALDAVSGIQPGEIDAALAKTVAALLAQARRLQPGPPATDSGDGVATPLSIGVGDRNRG